MKTSFKLIIAALAASLAFASCQKENDADNVSNAPSAECTRVLTLAFDSGTKATLDGLQPEFKNEELVRISNGSSYEDKQVSVSGGVATITTTLSGPLTAVIPPAAAVMDGNRIDGVKIPASQTGLVSDALICMATGAADATSLHFTCQTSLFIVTPPSGVKQFVIESSETINSASTPDDKSITVGDGAHAYGTYYVSLLPGVGLDKLTFVAGTVEKKISSSSATAFNTAYTINNTNWLPAGALSGKFSVASGKQVHFSKGNLTYNVTTDTWAFYEHQYDCATGYDANLISLFTWGYNATKSIVPDGVASDNVSITSGNLSQEQDWGCTIGDGNTWRTLTTAEWQYLFNNHVTVWGQCNSVNGYFIAPDGFVGDASTLSSLVSDWTAAEAAGIVFLPAAGYRDGSSVNYVDCGYYWSSSANGSTLAYDAYFDSSFVSPDYYDIRGGGCSVRLVTE